MDKTAMVINVFNKYANLYQEKYMNVDLYHSSFDLFCSLLPHGASVFEIGCGPGNITRYLLDRRIDFKILGTDIASNMIALAKVNNPEAEFELRDARDISSMTSHFNAVMCGFCLPYLSKEEAIQLICDASRLLLPGGILYLSTMEDDYGKSGIQKTSSGTDETYMYFHEADYLSEALLLHHFKIEHFHRQNFPTADGTKVIDLIIIAVKQSEIP